jgi:hypothetical protein
MIARQWLELWIQEGQQKWQGHRTVAVKLNNMRLIAAYQPLWDYGPIEMENFRKEIEDQLLQTNHLD